MDKKKLISILVIGIVLLISAISAFLLLGGKKDVVQPNENEGVEVNINKKDRNEDTDKVGLVCMMI